MHDSDWLKINLRLILLICVQTQILCNGALVTYQTLTDLSPIRGTKLQFIYYVHYAPQPCRGGARVFAWGGGGGMSRYCCASNFFWRQS